MLKMAKKKKRKCWLTLFYVFFLSSLCLLLCSKLISLENEVAESRTKSADLVTLKRYLFRVWAKKTSRNNYKSCDVINIKLFLQGLQYTVGLLNPIPFIFPNFMVFWTLLKSGLTIINHTDTNFSCIFTFLESLPILELNE